MCINVTSTWGNYKLKYLCNGLFTLSVSRTPEPGPEKMGCMRLYRTFHIAQGPQPHCFLLCWSRSQCQFRSRSKTVWLDHKASECFLVWPFFTKCCVQNISNRCASHDIVCKLPLSLRNLPIWCISEIRLSLMDKHRAKQMAAKILCRKFRC